MKKTILIMIAGIAAIHFGCTNMAPEFADDDPGQGDCTPEFPEMDVTYDNYVKKVMDKYCIGCHHGGNSPGPGNFTTYTGLLPYAEQSFYIRVIQDNADMPKGNAPLPAAIRDSLDVWISNCAPEN